VCVCVCVQCTVQSETKHNYVLIHKQVPIVMNSKFH